MSSIGFIEEVKKLVREDKIIISKHANARMVERDVLADDLVNLILNGESVKMIPDTCSCGKGRLKKGTTDFTVRVEGEIVVIRDVPAYVCDSCSEAYFSIETSRKIDEIMREFRAGRLLTKPLRAGEVELKLSAST